MKHVADLALRHLRARPRTLVAMLVLALAMAGLAVLPPLLVARAVDGAIEGGLTTGGILLLASGVAALAVLDWALTLWRRRIAVVTEMAVRDDAVTEHFRAAMRLPLAAYGMGREAALIRSFDDLDTLVQFAAARVVEMAAEVVLVTAYAVLLLAVPPLLALAFLGMAGIGFLVSLALASATHRACDAWLPLRDHRFGLIVDVLTGMLALRALGAELRLHRPFAAAHADETDALRRWRMASARADAAGRFFAVATPGIGAALGAAMLSAGAIGVAGLTLFLAVAAGLAGALSALNMNLQELAHARAAAGRLAALTVAPEPAPPAVSRADSDPARLAAEALHYHYDGASQLLAGLDLALPPGSHIALVGPSGEGKTTIALLLARLLSPDAGIVTLDGVAAATPEAHRERVVLVPHETSLFSASLRENIRLWAEEIDDDAINAALSVAGLAPLVATWPDGLDTPLGAHGAPLSAGQRQRLGIARALLRRPAVLILDEATGALDSATETAVLTAIRRLMAGRGLIAITHREKVAASFDRVLRLRGGLLEEVSGEADRNRDGA